MEDPILVLKLNAMWVAAHGQLLADNILDRITLFGMVGNNRRESGRGTARWIFHFDYTDDISECRADILANHTNCSTIGALGFLNLKIHSRIQANDQNFVFGISNYSSQPEKNNGTNQGRAASVIF